MQSMGKPHSPLAPRGSTPLVSCAASEELDNAIPYFFLGAMIALILWAAGAIGAKLGLATGYATEQSQNNQRHKGSTASIHVTYTTDSARRAVTFATPKDRPPSKYEAQEAEIWMNLLSKLDEARASYRKSLTDANSDMRSYSWITTDRVMASADRAQNYAQYQAANAAIEALRELTKIEEDRSAVAKLAQEPRDYRDELAVLIQMFHQELVDIRTGLFGPGLSGLNLIERIREQSERDITQTIEGVAQEKAGDDPVN